MNLTMPSKDEYTPICNFVVDTKARIEASDSCTKEALAVMDEFQKKSSELQSCISSGQKEKVKEAMIEVEQAADSTLRLAKKTKAFDGALVNHIKEAHDKVKKFKDEHLH